MGTYLLPVLATERLPYSFLAVTSQVVREQIRPRTGVSVAAIIFCFFHIRVRVAGSTAELIITPIMRYKYPIDMPIST